MLVAFDPSSVAAHALLTMEVLVNRYDAMTFDMGFTLVYFHPSEDELYLDAFRSLELYPDPEALRLARDSAWREYFDNAASATYDY